MRFVSLASLASALLASLTVTACTDDGSDPATEEPPPPAPAPGGTARFRTADAALLRHALDLGVFPASERLGLELDLAHLAGSWVGCETLVTATGPRSYTLAGPCTTGVQHYAGTASATNIDESTPNIDDTVANGDQPSIYTATAFADDRDADGTNPAYHAVVDGRVERSSPFTPWRIGRDVTTAADVTLIQDGVKSTSHLHTVLSLLKAGFQYGEPSTVAIEGLGDYTITGEITRGIAHGRASVDGWLELHGKDTLRAAFNDTDDASRCIELELDGAPFGSLCP